ncbi:hypothetical protein V7659_30170 [Neobacillus drentensis]|uniref:hypothetical protein n=1 Tax=Neobacillus drentensis TaxID=220684 RepID=UPI0030009DB2
MSTIVPNDNVLLQGLLNKIILYRFSRNLDKELRDRNINHSQISLATGRSGNWFNRSFNELEDMRVSTLIKTIVAASRIISQNNRSNPILISSVIDQEVQEIASFSLELMDIGIDDMLDPEYGVEHFFLKLKVYVIQMKSHISQEEAEAYSRVLERINTKER